jgi:nucleoside-diphosphate-sugar epimerase
MVNELRNRRIGLIGANGFIGSAILQALIQSGVAPLALCGPSETPRPIPDGIEMRSVDLTDTTSAKSWVLGLDVIIHAGGPPSVEQSFAIPEKYVRVHVQGTTALLHACHRANVERLVYISSAEVYGRPEGNPVSENYRLQARSPYAAAKIGAEKMIEAYAESFGLRAVILRPFSIYGSNPSPRSLFGTIIAMAERGSVSLRDLRPIRDYCYVADLAAAVLKAGCVAAERLEIFNIGSGNGTSIADFADLVLRCMGKNIPVTEQRSDARPIDSEIFELVADTSRARNVLGWCPETDLEQGLRRALGITAHKA